MENIDWGLVMLSVGCFVAAMVFHLIYFRRKLRSRMQERFTTEIAKYIEDNFKEELKKRIKQDVEKQLNEFDPKTFENEESQKTVS